MEQSVLERLHSLAATSGSTALLVSAVLVLVIWLLYPRKRYNMPPRISPCPPGQKAWLHYDAESKRTGSDVMYFMENGRPTVVLNSTEAIYDLMEKRSAIYSSRPPNILQNVARNWDSGPPMAYGPKWRSWRKLVHSALMSKAANNYKHMQTLESTVFMKSVLEKPEDWSNHMRNFACALVCQISYGFRPVNIDTDPVFIEHFKAIKIGQAAGRGQGANIIERWPWLRFAPSFMFASLREARAALVHDSAVWKGQFDEVKVRMDKGQAPWSLSRDIWSRPFEEHGLSHLACAYAATMCAKEYISARISSKAHSPFAIGIESQRFFLTGFFVAAASHGLTFLPRAYEEIDAAVGKGRMPTYDDLHAMPYIKAIGKELHRWAGLIPSGLPHALIADDTYNGYDLPKGSKIQPIFHHSHRDARFFPEPDRFYPERYLEGGSASTFPHIAGHFGWGVGRRICPGMHLAENSYELLMSRLIWAFELGASAPFDASEENMIAAGPLRLPKSVPITFKLRSPAHAKVIEEEWRGAQPDLREAEKR